MATLTTVIADVRAAVEREGTDVQITDVLLTTWINQEYLALSRRLADLTPDHYTVTSADFTIVSGASSAVLTANPPNITNLGKIRHLQRKEGGDYFSLPLAPPTDPDSAGYMCWRQRGALTVDVFPAISAPGTYRVRYVAAASILAGGTDALDLPAGGERVVGEAVAARFRVRVEEDPSPHLRYRDQAWQELRDSVAAQYLSTPTTVVDMTGVW